MPNVFCRHHVIAEKLADVATLKEYEEGGAVYEEGQLPKDCLFFIVSGTFDLLSGGNRIALMTEGQCVGEFLILNPSLSYTVTVRARERGVVAVGLKTVS